MGTTSLQKSFLTTRSMLSSTGRIARAIVTLKSLMVIAGHVGNLSSLMPVILSRPRTPRANAALPGLHCLTYRPS